MLFRPGLILRYIPIKTSLKPSAEIMSGDGEAKVSFKSAKKRAMRQRRQSSDEEDKEQEEQLNHEEYQKTKDLQKLR